MMCKAFWIILAIAVVGTVWLLLPVILEDLDK